MAGQCGNEAGPDRRTDSKVNANGSGWMPLGSHRRSPPPRRTRSTADVGSCSSCHPPNGIRCRRSDCWRSRFYSGLAERHGAKVSFEQSRAPAWASVFHQGQGPKIKIKPERLVSEQLNPPARGCSGARTVGSTWFFGAIDCVILLQCDIGRGHKNNLRYDWDLR